LLGAATAAYAPWPGLRWTDSKRPLQDTLSRLVERDSGTGRERVADARLSIALAVQSPVWGVGPRSWDDAASSAAHEVAGRHATPQHFWTTPNSDAARTLAERGFVGFALLVSALLALLVRALRHWQRAEGELIALVGALSVAAVNMLLDAPLFRASSLLSIALLLALLRVPGPRVCTLPRTLVRAGFVSAAVLITLATGMRAYAAAGRGAGAAPCARPALCTGGRGR
jgi:hypothetical protein